MCLGLWWFHCRQSSLCRQLYTYFCPHLIICSFLNLLNHFSLCQEIFGTLFRFLSTLGVLWTIFSPHTKSWVVCAPCSHASTLPFVVSCQKFQEQSHPSPVFPVFNSGLMFCSVSMPFSLSYFSSRSSKEFLKYWGWLNETKSKCWSQSRASRKNLLFFHIPYW